MGKINTYLFLLVSCILLAGCGHSGNVTVSEELPPVYPDYTNVSIPYNIAPLNFLLRNKPGVVEIKLKGKTKELLIRDSYKVQFAQDTWKSLMEAEKGNTIKVQITAKVGGEWIQYAPFHWHVVSEAIDPYLSYRLIEPGYEVWNKIQLRERNLENFNERVIADNNLTDNSCMNCHTYGNQDPNLSFFHLRGATGGTILNRNGQLRKLTTKANELLASLVYGNFHPSGRYGVFSSNIILPAFHTYKSERLEVYDTESELYVLDFDKNRIIPLPEDTIPEKPFRTFPVFSANGTSVYYCEAPRVSLPDSIHQLMYSLHRIDFDAASCTFGSRVDTLFSASEEGKSICHLKTSPDGKYIMYTIADYGTFPIWHRETDLQMIDLNTGEINELQAVNATCSDTYHSWSSDSRWFVFASKRDDGLYGKPYFSYIDEQGVAHKPFVLPQRDPAFYDYTLKSFNIPELSKGKLPFDALDIERMYWHTEADTMRLMTH
ncbi:hypothetical protein M2459_001222 [Parabacteroides sp. PF5-5]|uniref:TolB family protein n=1 Tax=unclassified Parabacteroides TaxID=2649774 RepID=UPI0024759664|nr:MULTISPECIES: hypothetical protein [unclassified Parabacteroides]MDH6304489.1 hypothetical protein [Parabacteroides sp. PH5-39]MDH6315358.1 hypothetical protein [Parabacteroides sp. PF5-13]MDH6319148.1 hypothetical protein [Parabacteroides sp. PH5-13]MDH6322878.1 hypothetical protein [Parabacteroides sp. PH5-8]MDH6326550.1 hypothetical protein [Parabacteroides sp. PH5-41]